MTKTKFVCITHRNVNREYLDKHLPSCTFYSFGVCVCAQENIVCVLQIYGSLGFFFFSFFLLFNRQYLFFSKVLLMVSSMNLLFFFFRCSVSVSICCICSFRRHHKFLSSSHNISLWRVDISNHVMLCAYFLKLFRTTTFSF